jgi:hypothetical protein
MPQSQQLSATLWALAVGGGLILVIYFAVRSGWFRKGGNDVVPTDDVLPEPAEPVHEYPDGLGEAHGRIPFVLKGFIVGYVIFLAFYIVYFVQALNGPLGVLDKFLTE